MNFHNDLRLVDFVIGFFGCAALLFIAFNLGFGSHSSENIRVLWPKLVLLIAAITALCLLNFFAIPQQFPH